MQFIMAIHVCASILAANCIVTDQSNINNSTTISNENYLISIVFGAITASSPSVTDVCLATDHATLTPRLPESDNNNIRQQQLPKTFIDHYNDGLRSYMVNDWETCAYAFEAAIDGYRDYQNVVTSCRIECTDADERRQRAGNYFDTDLVGGHLHFYESAVRRTLCERHCTRTFFGNAMFNGFHMDRESAHVFAARKPYEYLQLCYYRVPQSIVLIYIYMRIRPG